MTLRREGLVVFVAGYLVHAALALVMRVPIVMYDEYGYFATARRLAGEGQATHLRYFPGYAFALIPAFLVTPSSDAAYHVSLLVINGLLGALTTLLVWQLVRVLAPELSRRVRLLATLAVAVYPSWLLYTDLTWSENLIVPIGIALVLLAGRLARGAPAWVALAYGVLAGAAYLTHPRGLAMTGAAVVVGLVVLAPAGRLLRAGLMLVPAVALTIATPAIARWATDSNDFRREVLLRRALSGPAAPGGVDRRAGCSISQPRRTDWRRSASTRWSAWCGARACAPSAAPSRWRRWPPPPGCCWWRASTGTTRSAATRSSTAATTRRRSRRSSSPASSRW